jgi:hypothetical protein
VAVEVPRRTFKKLPASIPVYATDQTRLPVEGVKWIINHAIDDPAERKALNERIDANPSLLTAGKVYLKNDDHGCLYLNPESGIVHYTRGSRDWPKIPLTNAPPVTISLDTFKQELQELASKLHIDDREIARKPDGDYFRMVSDNERYPHHQKEPILYKRAVHYSRGPNGFVMLPGQSGSFEITLARFISGEWCEVFVWWPTLKAVGARRTYVSNSEIEKAIKSGKCLWDYNNESTPEDVKEITVTGLRIVYSVEKDGSSTPAMCLDCEMKTDRGKEYEVLFLPLSPTSYLGR